jgi:hypothetical protein
MATVRSSGSKQLQQQYHAAIVTLGVTVCMFSMLILEGRAEVPPTGTISLINEFSTNLSMVCFSDVTDNPTFIAAPSQQYGFMFETASNQYWDCAFQAKQAVPFRGGTFLFWGNPNVPSSNSSQLNNCMNCNWKVGADGLFLQQPDQNYLLRWTWPAVPDV